MKNVILLLIIFILATPVFAAPFENDQQKLSYAIGMSIGSDLRRQKMELVLDQLIAGISISYKEAEGLLSEEEMVKVLVAYQQEIQQKQKLKAAELAAENSLSGQEFRDKNMKKSGVITTASGLQYEVLTEGKGASPKPDDRVKVHYRGTLIDGSEFDSSYKRGKPASFQVGGVIPGWTEALQLMKEGGKLRLVIPPALAYGDRGAPPVIGPGSTLIFEVELIEVVKK